MNEWAFFTFGDFLRHLDEADQFSLALAAHEPPLPIQLFDEPLPRTTARIRCFLRITDHVRHHAEAYWAAGLLQDREHFLGVQIRLWRAVHSYFTAETREADAADPATADMIRIALADAA